LICRALKKENIRYRVDCDKKDNSTNIIITRWDNYLKLWEIKTFDVCKRKKDKFIDIAKNLDIYLSLNSQFREKFFKSLNMYQWEIAKIIGSWQANICRTIDGTHLLKIEQIIKLLNCSGYNMCKMLNNSNYVRIGSLTKLEINNTTVNFLKEFKSL